MIWSAPISESDAPAATPKDIVARLNAETVKVVSNPDTRAFMQAQGGEATGSTPDQLGALLRDELAMWGRVVKATGIKLD